MKASAAFGYLLKPFHVKSLLIAIEMAVQRFQTERRLEESQLTYATILGSISDGVIATDTQGGVRFMNAVAERITGWPLSEAQGESSRLVLRFADREGAPGEDHLVAHVVATRAAISLGADEYVISRSGELVPVDGAISPVIDTLGRLVGTTITLRDVTESRRAVQAVQAMAERLRAVVDTAVDGVLLLDAQGRILMSNPACLRLFGCEGEELSGLSVEEFMPSPLASGPAQALPPDRADQAESMRISAQPTTVRRRDRSTFRAEISVGAAIDREQPVFVCVIHDVSERIELEKALLDAVGREQRRFGDDLHDGLGQELTGLSLLLAAMARSARDALALEPSDLDRAQDVARHAIQSCRSIARGLSPVAETQGGLIAGLRDLVVRLKTPSGPSVDFTATEASRLGLSAAVADHLYRIAQEALSNALRHSHAHSITVRFAVEPELVRLEICDDGDGMRLPGTRLRGLGLRTMRYRADVIGARLQIERSGTAGTCVVCDCPQAASHPGAVH